MHPSSMATMRRFINEYLSLDKKTKIIDIGSLDINGSYRELFDNKLWEYIGIDIKEGDNVDVVLEKHFNLPFDDKSIDVVISGQAIEHMSHPWLMMEEIGRVLKKNGFCCMVVPSAGCFHEEKDYWRVFPEGMRVFAEIAGLQIIDLGSSGGTWNDTYLIAKKVN